MNAFVEKRRLIPLLKSLVVPDERYDFVKEIPVEPLYADGYRTLLLDIDNTLMTYKTREVSLNNVGWVDRAKRAGFEIFLVSNNSSKRRTSRVVKQLNLPCVYFSMKPFPFTAQSLAEEHGFDLETSIVIGDQVLTDIVMGKWLNTYTVLVDPIDKRSSLVKIVQRKFEQFLLRFLDDR